MVYSNEFSGGWWCEIKEGTTKKKLKNMYKPNWKKAIQSTTWTRKRKTLLKVEENFSAKVFQFATTRPLCIPLTVYSTKICKLDSEIKHNVVSEWKKK